MKGSLKFKEITKKISIIKHILYYFVIVIVMSIGISSLTNYFYTSALMTKEEIRKKEIVLEQLKETTDIVMNNVDNCLDLLAKRQDLMNITRYYKDSDFMEVKAIKDDIDSLIYIAFEFIDSIAICYMDDGLIFIPHSGVIPIDEFPDKDMLNDIKGQNYVNQWFPVREMRSLHTSAKKNVIPVVRSGSLGFGNNSTLIVVYVDEAYLRRVIDSVGSDASKVFILDDLGEAISVSDFQIDMKSIEPAFENMEGNYTGKLHNEKYLVSYTTSSYNKWKYIGMSPYSNVSSKAIVVAWIFILSTLLACITGFIISYFFSGKIFRPVVKLADMFNESAYTRDYKNEDVYAFISDNVTHLHDKNTKFELVLRDYGNVLKSNFFYSLLKGESFTMDEIKEKINYFNIDINLDAKFKVYLLKVLYDNDKEYSEKQINTLTVYLIDNLNRYVAEMGNSVVVNMSSKEISIIVELHDEFTETDFVEAMPEFLVEIGIKRFCISEGSVCENLSDIYISYQESLDIMGFSYVMEENTILKRRDIEKIGLVEYSYPFEMERKLIDAINKDKKEQALKLNRGILDKFSKENIPDTDKIFKYIQYLNSIIKCASENDVLLSENLSYGAICLKIIENKDTKMREQIITEVLEEIFLKISAGKVCNSDIIVRIKEYIHNNYSNELSIQILADYVFFSVNYLCKVFKDETGLTIKQYINDVRMDKAKELLKDPSNKVADVALKIGYDKIHGFLKMFKEYTGMTPSEYRKRNID